MAEATTPTLATPEGWVKPAIILGVIAALYLLATKPKNPGNLQGVRVLKAKAKHLKWRRLGKRKHKK